MGESNLNPTVYYQDNVGGTAALLEAMRECGIGKIVFSSSCAVYGAPAVVPISETTPDVPINPYGATKKICEQMLRECAVSMMPSLNRMTVMISTKALHPRMRIMQPLIKKRNARGTAIVPIRPRRMAMI
ncbi:MAG: NAD-dependent epimerase/dehydratase family protein [Xanthobacteraceae bacterium]